MQAKRKIEIYSAGCPGCKEAIQLVNNIACSSCEIEVLDMQLAEVAARAKQYGISRVPAVVVDGKLADCCQPVQGIDEAILRALGVGQAS
jgi:glutaredoxin